MPDPSGEPVPPPQEPPPPPRPVPSAATPAHLAPAPRIHPAAVHLPKEPPAIPPPPPDLRATLEWLRQYGKLDIEPEGLTPAQAQAALVTRAQLSRDQRKFHKFDPEHPTLAASDETVPHRAGAVLSNEPSDESSSADDYPRGISREQIAYIRRLRADTTERRLQVSLGIAVVAFLLVAAAFLAKSPTVWKLFAASPPIPAAAPTPSGTFDPTRALSAGVLALLDQAMAAESAANYSQAIDLLDRAEREAGHIYGLNYRRAFLCYKANAMTRVVPLLDLSISQGEDVAACYSLRGTLSNQAESTSQEPGDLEKATRLEPFNARYFFAWGEALRRAGKPRLAVVQLQRALARLQEPAPLGGVVAQASPDAGRSRPGRRLRLRPGRRDERSLPIGGLVADRGGHRNAPGSFSRRCRHP